MSMYCPECRETCGFHERADPAGQPVLDERGDPVLYRPHVEEARAQKAILEQARTIAADVHTEAFKRGLDIVRTAARGLHELSSNNVRAQLQAADIPPSLYGSVFTRLQKEGALEHVGYVMSTDPATRHRIGVYRSLICRAVAS